MKKYPQEPKDWKSGEFVVHRTYKFRSTPDIECLMRLVKENLSDRGNEGYLKARLEGILFSMFSEANRRFWKHHKYPNTWKLRLFLENVKRWYQRVFNTRYYRGQVMLYNLSVEVIDELKEEKKV